MNVVTAINPLEYLLLMLLGGGMGLPSGVPPAQEDPVMAKAAPAECIFYTSWAGTAAPLATSTNHTERLLAEPEIQKFLNRGQGLALAALNDVEGRDMADSLEYDQAKLAVKQILAVLGLIQAKPGAFFVSELHLSDSGPPDIKGGGLIRVNGDGKELTRRLTYLQQLTEAEITEVMVDGRPFSRIQFEDAPSITWGIGGPYLVVGIGDGSAEDVMKQARTPVPQWLRDARAKLTIPRVSSTAYIDIQKITELGYKAAGYHERPHEIEVLGVDKLRSLTVVNGLDNLGCVSRSLLSIDGKGTGALSWIEGAPLAARDLKLIPANTPVAIAFQLDLRDLFDVFMETATELAPAESEQMAAGLAGFEEQIGIKIRDELLSSLGNAWRVFVRPSAGGLLTGWTLAIEVRNRARLEQVQATLLGMAQAALGQAPDGPKIRTSRGNGVSINTVDLGLPGVPASPSWCVTDDELLVTMSPQLLTQLLSSAGARRTLADQPDVRRMVARDSNTLAFAFINTRVVAKSLLPLMKMGLAMIAAQPGLPPMDTSNLPPADLIIKHLQPTRFTVRRTADGIEMTSHQTLPGGNGATTIAPVAVALMLPAVSSARSAARRMQGSNQLKQLALANHNFHDVYKAFPASHSADANGQPLLSWRVHVLPFVDQAALYEEFHLDEPWDSPHNMTLVDKMPLVYVSPKASGKPGMTNYLGMAGDDGVFVAPPPGDRVGTGIREIRDGTSKTILLVEVPDESAVIWTKPGDFTPDPDEPTQGLMGLHPGGFQVSFADGSVRFLGEGIDAGVLQALFTKAGGELVPAIDN